MRLPNALSLTPLQFVFLGMTSSVSTRTETLLRSLVNNELSDLAGLFAPGAVRIALPDETASEPQAQLIYSMLVNLVSRLFPVVQRLELVVPRKLPLSAQVPRWRAQTFDAHITGFLSALNPDTTYTVVSVPSPHKMYTVVVGAGDFPNAELFVGSVGWKCELDVKASCATTGDPNPVGAYAVACLAAGEVWKSALTSRSQFSHLPIFPIQERLTFSTYSLLTTDDSAGPPLPATLELPALSVIGAGAGGGAILYTLASLPDLSGSVFVVDPDAVETSNLNRYIFADGDDAEHERPKPAVIATMLGRFPRLRTVPLDKPFETVATSLPYEYVAAAVHSRTARRDIQMETPRVLWDCAATSDGEFRVWRHLLGRSDCMWCKHPEAGDPERQKSMQLEQLLGLDTETWVRKIRNNEPFTQQEIASLKIPDGSEITLPASGERFDAWEAAQCGRMKLPELNAEVPIPFAPVMAGVLIAGEIIKELRFPANALDSYYWNTLTGQFMRRKRPECRRPTPGCPLCQNEVFRAQYSRRWGITIPSL